MLSHSHYEIGLLALVIHSLLRVGLRSVAFPPLSTFVITTFVLMAACVAVGLITTILDIPDIARVAFRIVFWGLLPFCFGGLVLRDLRATESTKPVESTG